MSVTEVKGFDPVVYKSTTREQWQAAAGAWNAWGPQLERWLSEATELMLDLAAVRTWIEIEQALREFKGPDGFVGPCQLLVAAGTK
jgi:hypothetical protein